jgi:hypothetical protein
MNSRPASLRAFSRADARTNALIDEIARRAKRAGGDTALHVHRLFPGYREQLRALVEPGLDLKLDSDDWLTLRMEAVDRVLVGADALTVRP